MRRTLLTFWITICAFQLFAQEKKALDCGILESMMHHEEFINHFRINRSDSPLIIVDTNNYFRKCQLSMLEGRAVSISRAYPRTADVNKGGGIENRDKIIIYSLISDKHSYTISFWQPYDNANLVLCLKLRKHKVKVMSSGVF